MDQEVQAVKLVEELACGVHFFDGRDMSVELEGLHARMTSVEDECPTEAGKLSMLVVGISNALVDLKMLPIWDIPQLPKIAQKILTAAGLIPERL
jgi:hypothetical protein